MVMHKHRPYILAMLDLVPKLLVQVQVWSTSSSNVQSEETILLFSSSSVFFSSVHVFRLIKKEPIKVELFNKACYAAFRTINIAPARGPYVFRHSNLRGGNKDWYGAHLWLMSK